MSIRLVEAPTSNVADVARIAIAFRVDRTMQVTPRHDGSGFALAERPVAAPYIKDYDAIDGNHPSRWASRFDTSTWGLIEAYATDDCVGAAVIAVEAAEATLWDLRVSPAMRGAGVGTALFRAAEAWAVARGFRELVAETQDINVPACRFYERQGCTLWKVNRLAYPQFPDEIQLLWRKPLAATCPA